jgi:hypothetical protein
MNMISDNYWSTCKGVNSISLFEMIIFMFVGEDIEH